MRPAAEKVKETERVRDAGPFGGFPKEHVQRDVCMSGHTTFRIGGPADWFLTPSDAGEIRDMIRVCGENGIPFFIMGNGSNLLVADGGYRGAVIALCRNFSAISRDGIRLRAQAGALLSSAAQLAAGNGLTGLEFASGIPGTVGGACFMNAGAYGGEIGAVTESLTCLTKDGAIRTFGRDALSFGYRTSSVAERGDVVLEAEFVLEEGDPVRIEERMRELRMKRCEKQPLSVPSAGSTFRRPEGFFAGRLIEEAGLRGFRIGGACVSEKHCGFLVNDGGATAADVRALIRCVQERVRENSGVSLEPEIRFLGVFDE